LSPILQIIVANAEIRVAKLNRQAQRELKWGFSVLHGERADMSAHPFGAATTGARGGQRIEDGE